MKKKLFSLVLALVLCLGLIVPVSAANTRSIGQRNSMSASGQSCFVDTNGTLWMWGNNADGQLGNGTRINSAIPVRIMENVASVSTSNGTTAAVKEDGTLWIWGRCGGLIADYLDEWLWGDRTKVSSSLVPFIKNSEDLCYVYTSPVPYPATRMNNISAVSLQAGCIAVIKSDGTLWMWGNNNVGQIKTDLNNYDPMIETPVKVMDHVTAVSGGNNHIVAIRDDGSLWTWGDNEYGQLGNGTVENGLSAPLKVLEHVSAVSCGASHTIALKDDGTLWAWGLNNQGQLGIGGVGNHTYTVQSDFGGGSTTYNMQTVPLQVLSDVSNVSCGGSFTAAVKKDGTLWTWGFNQAGQLGDGEKWTSSSPKKVLQDIVNVCCGPQYAIAAKTDGTIWSWGSNEYGELGNGGAANRSYTRRGVYEEGTTLKQFPYQDTPVQVSGLLPFSLNDSNEGTAPTVSGFTDIKSSDYFADAVQWAVEKKITSGTSATTFSPNSTCTNAQILAFLYRANGSPEPTISNSFADIKTTDYYYKAALWAAEKGMVSGSTFGANTPCTRAATVEYMWKAAGSPAAAYDGKFDDVPASADYAQAVAWAVENNVTAGTSKTTFGPDSTCTRGQIVTFLYRAFGK